MSYKVVIIFYKVALYFNNKLFFLLKTLFNVNRENKNKRINKNIIIY